MKAENGSALSTEWFDIVDGDDAVIGRAPRAQCHGNPRLIHRTAHVLVFSSDGQMLLQKRTPGKDIQPGRWDTAVGGHLALGEDYEAAARREMAEEIGIPGEHALEFLFSSCIRNHIESENVQVFKAVHDGPFIHQEVEIDELRFWRWDDLVKALGSGILTPNLEAEIQQLKHGESK